MTATWTVRRVPQDQVNAEFLFGIAKRHRMVFDNPGRMVDYYGAISRDCIVLEVVTETGETAADVIISDIIEGESASVDMILVAKHYAPVMADGSRNETPFNDMTSDAVRPAFLRLMEARKLRRITAMIPKSRSRTFRALIACGFKKEGTMRRAVKFAGKDAEDLIITGLLAPEE